MTGRVTFDVVAPQIAIHADLPRIKAQLHRNGAAVHQFQCRSADFQAFAPHLEGHWGVLQERLPQFHEDLVCGKWQGAAGQQVPTSLLGDFGEFVACHVFLKLCASAGSIVCRVPRANRPRPDFLIFDPKTKRIVAIEVKAHSENAMRLRSTIRPRASLNLCQDARNRRQDGCEQIATSVLMRPTANTTKARFAKPAGAIGASRVLAHASAVITPVFLDGRVLKSSFVSPDRFTQPQRCQGFTCVRCVASGGAARVLAPIFGNDELQVAPLLHPSVDGTALFEGYSAAARALWVRSASAFRGGWATLLDAWRQTIVPDEDATLKVQPLLDVLASGVEADIGISDAQLAQALGVLAEIVGPDELALACTQYRYGDLRGGDPGETKVADGGHADPGPPARVETPPIESETHAVPTLAGLSGEVTLEGPTDWARSVAAPGEPRARTEGAVLDRGTDTEGLRRAFLNEAPDREHTAVFVADGKSEVLVLRESRQGSADTRIRIVANDEAEAVFVAEGLLVSDRQLGWHRSEEASAVRVDDHPVARALRVTYTNDSGARVATVIANGQGMAVLTLHGGE